jgi:regulator of sigma E protease
MDFVAGLGNSIIWFLVVLTVLVFVHELGHYWAARRCGVRVEVFSIGFGPELFGYTDRSGTRWKFSAIPLGGYVKMFGDADPASTPSEAVKEMTPAERAESFFYKTVGQRAFVVIMGPAANFAFAIVTLALLFATMGQPFTPPQIGAVQPDSAAARAGLLPGDVIVAIDGWSIQRFEEIQQVVRLRPDQRLELAIERDGKRQTLPVTPASTEFKDRLGNVHKVGLLGISRSGVEYKHHDPLTAVWQAMRETVSLTSGTLTAIGQMITGTRGSEEIGGPLRIAQMSGEFAQSGFDALIWFMVILSINLGLINLFPIPLLDGGHLMFYAIEGLRGRPLGEQAQKYGFRIGLALVLTLTVFATWNDLVHLRVVDFVRNLIS